MTKDDARAAARPLPRPESDALIGDESAGIARLLELMRRLRAPEDGCPWDVEQSFATIAPYTVEEAYEVADVIEREAWGELPDELGDLLLQVVYHSQMAAEAGLFGWDDVVAAITAKMIRRHPHVFGDMAREEFTAGSWERMKDAERAAPRASALDGVPVGLPGLTRAAKLQKRAARVGFDWPDVGGVTDKIAEEAAELAEALKGDDRDAVEDEFADLMFTVVNLGRWLKIDPEAAMRRVNAKFERRFRAVEAALKAKGRAPEDATLAEMEAHWIAAKSGD